MRKKIIVVVAVSIVVATAAAVVLRITRGPRTVADVVERYGPEARKRLAPHFKRAGVAYPPKQIALLVFKQEKRLSLWARSSATAPWRFIRHYPILAASGHAGPKLREGDRQVPEGVYRIESMNPNSSYHLSMKVNYPDDFDRRMAARDGRTQLGGDIFIHGNQVSIGCVAVGDPAIEELFTLVAETGRRSVDVIIAPNDLRAGGAVIHESAPMWVRQLYRVVAAALVEFPLWMESNSSFDVTGEAKVRKAK